MNDKWPMPKIKINGSQVCYDFIDNYINLGVNNGYKLEHLAAPTASPEEMYTACLIHELMHWAQTQPVSKEERHEMARRYDYLSPRENMIERHAIEIEDDWLRKIGRLTKR